MKYTITILAILALASCKKDYTCQCNDKDGHNVRIFNYNLKKKDKGAIESMCPGQAAAYNIQYPDKAPITCVFE